MIPKAFKRTALIITLFALTCTGFSQAMQSELQLLLSDKNILPFPSSQLPQVRKFYESIQFNTAWVRSENKSDCGVLLHMIERATEWGLRPVDYSVDYIREFYKGNLSASDINDSLIAEAKITAAALQFLNDRVYGNTTPSFGYDGLNYTPSCYDISLILADNIRRHTLAALSRQFFESLPEIQVLEEKLRFIQSIITGKNFQEVSIGSSKVDLSNNPLITKLYQLGHLDTVTGQLSTASVKEALKSAQRGFQLISDGVLRSTALAELNVPLATRYQQLILSINYYRWVYCLSQNQPVIVVNIPAAYLNVYKNGKVILEMRMVLGTTATPTPTLASRVTDVVLYPYWHVPYSIATKELLPRIRKNPAYLDAGNYQVLDLSGRVVNHYKINWQQLNSKHFPYIIRQSTGCDNSLGLLKLNFYSPFGVYLHDTPFKSAFLLNRRYFSHGCLRMEKPMELGRLVLKDNRVALDTLEEKGCLLNQAPITVPAEEKMPVIVWYNPAGIDSTGQVIFYNDIYKRIKRVLSLEADVI